MECCINLTCAKYGICTMLIVNSVLTKILVSDLTFNSKHLFLPTVKIPNFIENMNGIVLMNMINGQTNQPTVDRQTNQHTDYFFLRY